MGALLLTERFTNGILKLFRDAEFGVDPWLCDDVGLGVDWGVWGFVVGVADWGVWALVVGVADWGVLALVVEDFNPGEV